MGALMELSVSLARKGLSMSIEQALQKYVLQLRGNGRSDHTIGQVRRHVRLFEAWLDANDDLAGIDHETVALFLASEVVTKRADRKARKSTSANALRSPTSRRRAGWSSS
jgi:hypothetical protein